jgi:small subunit ribosomal protein S20
LPQHKSSKKSLKQSAKEKTRNIAIKTALRKTLKETRTKLAEGQSIDLNTICTSIDKVRGKGTIHKNKAARLKSRLAKAASKSKKTT